MADKNKVTFGLSNVHLAPIDMESLSTGNPSWDAYIKVPGVVDLSLDAETGEYSFYADNGIYYATYSDNGYSGDLEVAKIPDNVLVALFAWIVDQATGGIIEVTDGQKRNFALAAQMEGDIHARRFVYYNCAAGKPTQTAHTVEESTEAQTQTLPVTVMPIDMKIETDTRKITKFVLSKDDAIAGSAAAYDNFFDAVYIPETITTTTAGG